MLKGALLFVAWSARPHRATKDLDLLGRGTPDPARLVGIFREVCQVAAVDDGVTFLAETVIAEPIREEAVYDGIRLRFSAQLGTAKIPVQVDVGFGDATTPEPQSTVLPVLLDFPPPRLRAYARESTIAEKLHAMVELGLGNSRMKDYYEWAAFLRRARLRKEAPPLDLLVVFLRSFLIPVVDAAGAPSAFDTVWRPGGPWQVR